MHVSFGTFLTLRKVHCTNVMKSLGQHLSELLWKIGDSFRIMRKNSNNELFSNIFLTKKNNLDSTDS